MEEGPTKKQSSFSVGQAAAIGFLSPVLGVAKIAKDIYDSYNHQKSFLQDNNSAGLDGSLLGVIFLSSLLGLISFICFAIFLSKYFKNSILKVVSIILLIVFPPVVPFFLLWQVNNPPT